MTAPRRLVIGISGASGVVYGVRLLEVLRASDIETHLVVSKSAEMTLAYETGHKLADLHAMADHVHAAQDVGAAIASGSFKTMGMIVAPCSIRSLAPQHVKWAWKGRLNRSTGALMIATQALLIATGYALYYAGGEDSRVVASDLHLAVGIGVPLILVWHVVEGRRRRRQTRRATRWHARHNTHYPAAKESHAAQADVGR